MPGLCAPETPNAGQPVCRLQRISSCWGGGRFDTNFPVQRFFTISLRLRDDDGSFMRCLVRFRPSANLINRLLLAQPIRSDRNQDSTRKQEEEKQPAVVLQATG